VERGQGTAGVIQLRPTSNQWTDEVDIVETHRPDRSAFAFTNHGDPNETQYVEVDVGQWHSSSLVWKPDLLKLKVDGRTVAQMTHDVPDQPMSFGMQGMVLAEWETWFGGAPDHTTPDQVDMRVDWVRVSEWNGG
jgi:beta-glucanase (GH16 family)